MLRPPAKKLGQLHARNVCLHVRVVVLARLHLHLHVSPGLAPYSGKCEKNACANTGIKLDFARPLPPKLNVVDGHVGFRRFRAFFLHAQITVCTKRNFES